MTERDGASLFTLLAGAAIGYAGYCLYKNARLTLPADATLRAMNPILKMAEAADAAKSAARDVASNARGVTEDALQAARDQFGRGQA